MQNNMDLSYGQAYRILKELRGIYRALNQRRIYEADSLTWEPVQLSYAPCPPAQAL